MVESFKYEKRSAYPHMKPADVALWERFIEKYPDAYDTCEYDFWVGSPPPFNPIVNEETMGSADGLYRLKIDVVGHKGSGIDIIEVKPRADAKAIGQIKEYVRLYFRDEKPATRPQAVIITDTIRQDFLEAAAAEKVALFLV